jgi:hypothetical protein
VVYRAKQSSDANAQNADELALADNTRGNPTLQRIFYIFILLDPPKLPNEPETFIVSNQLARIQILLCKTVHRGVKMNKKDVFKKALITSMTLAMVMGSASSAFADGKGNGPGKGHGVKMRAKSDIILQFSDMDRNFDWAMKHVASLASKKVFKGYDDGTFKPRKPVTRMEALITAVRLMGLSDEAESEAKMGMDLSIVDGNHIEKKYPRAVGYVSVALENGLLSASDALQPQKAADRLWATKLLVIALNLEDEAKAKTGVKLTFKDSAEIPAEDVGYVAVALEKGMITGYANHTFRPHKPVTRAELAVILDKAGNQLPDADDNTIRGTVSTAVSGNTLVIVNGEQTQQLTMDPSAFVFRNGVKVTAAQLQPGDEVLVRSYNNVVIFVEVTTLAEANSTFNGVVAAAVNGNGLTVIRNGQTVQYPVAANADIYRAGVRVPVTSLKAGDEIFARTQNNIIVFLQVTELAENKQFTVSGLFHSLTLNAEGKISTISLSQTVNGTTQVSFYNVSSGVTIVGDASLLTAGRTVELKGTEQLVHSIEIK